MLDQAWRNFDASARPELRADFERFCSEEAHWLDDYALFRALKARLRGADLLDWPEDLLRRNPSALARARRDLADEINESRFGQFLLSRQGNRLKEYAHERGVFLIGDLPFFVSLDSSDVWANPECFQLDANLRPRFVAGVPPDYFSAKGQLWGNPVYDWEALRRSGYRWCIDRLKSLLAHVDLVRLDHFRAFCAAWHVPPTAKTAEPGHWVPGPGAAFFEAVRAELGHLPFIAEDLGIITPDVVALRDKFELPGIRVFQFGFDGNPGNPHLPHNCGPNTVAYTGTHDNNTTRGWFESLPEHVRQAARSYVAKAGAGTGEVAWDFIQSVWSSKVRARHRSAAGPVESGCRGPHERARRCHWQLALALHGGDAQALDFRAAARTDNFYWAHGRSNGRATTPGGLALKRRTNMKATKLLHNLGQSLWLDNITRDLLNSGTLKRYIDELSVTGLTSNPTIFDHAIKNSRAYDAAIRVRLAQGNLVNRCSSN